MTAEEVRNQLEELIKDRESFMVGNYDKDIYDRDKEALEFAVKAVEKQIPKKLAIKGRVTENGAIIGHYYCPTCEIYAVIHLYNGKYLKPNNCINCGQALDWSGEDE